MAGALLPFPVVVALAVVLASVAALRRRGSALAVLAAISVAAAVSAGAAHSRVPEGLADVPIGFGQATMRVLEDPSARWGGYGVGQPMALDGVSWRGPPLAVGPLTGAVEAGGTLVLEGRIRGGQRRLGQDVVAGTFEVDEVVSFRQSQNPVFRFGNLVRSRVRSTFDGGTSANGLAIGLLVGDTSGIVEHDMEDLRRSGLAHYVAVSGSNVAVFLGAWWIIGMPLSINPRTRSVFGLVGLAVFIVATRWEPSVVRASMMAGVVLVGGGIGVPVDPWMALGVAVTGLVLVSGELAGAVGFQLSILATAGVLIGVRLVGGRRPAWLWTPLAATVGAQAAVAPLLLGVFGSIPLLAPITNLLAGPIVAMTTMVGVAALVIPVDALAVLASLGAGAVLHIASAASSGPQLDTAAFIGAAMLALGAVWRSTRPIALGALIVVLTVVAISSPSWPTTATAVVLDVGQGDAVLLQDPSGATMLVDGGRDPAVLDRALRRHGIHRIDILVVTHGDSDHVGGLAEILRSQPVGAVWVPEFAEYGPILEALVLEAGDLGIPVRPIGAGRRSAVGSIAVDVLGPTRRFQADNDGSIVMLIDAGRTLLLAGDAEAVAQAELPSVRPDVLLVPHHGSGTTDLRWLTATVGPLAILSYGPNTYGHPHPDVLEALELAGATVRATAVDGDVHVTLTR